eukprot:scaffold991_cov279-Chaetoceros_neogracile.AAC.25
MVMPQNQISNNADGIDGRRETCKKSKGNKIEKGGGGREVQGGLQLHCSTYLHTYIVVLLRQIYTEREPGIEEDGQRRSKQRHFLLHCIKLYVTGSCD